MALIAMWYSLLAILAFTSPGKAAHLRSAGRRSHSLSARQSTEDFPALAMGMPRPQRGSKNRADVVNLDRVTLDQTAGLVLGSSSPSASSSSSAITTTSTTTTDLTVTVTSTVTAARALPTGRYASGEQWLPHGSSIDVRELASPETPHRYNSSGDCVDMTNYSQESSAIILSYLEVADGLSCKFYLLPNCNAENVLLMEGDLHKGGFWNATQLWTINIVSSFQCWPTQCDQPNPPFDYSIGPSPTFTCTERVPNTALPNGLESQSFRQTVVASSSSGPYNVGIRSSPLPSQSISSAPSAASSSVMNAHGSSSSLLPAGISSIGTTKSGSSKANIAGSSASQLTSEVASATPTVSSSSFPNVASSSQALTSTITITTTYAIGLGRRTPNERVCSTHTVTRSITKHRGNAVVTTASMSNADSDNSVIW